MKEKLLAALLAKGLTEAQAAVYASLITVESESEIDGVATKILGAIPANQDQSEIDRRVTQAVNTAIVNYEKKHNLKEGKPIEPEKKEPATPPTKPNDPKLEENPAIKALMESVTALTETVKGFQEKEKKQERTVKIQSALSEAKIPEPLRKRFSIPDEATDEEIASAITEYQQELANIGISGLKMPGKGGAGNEPDVALFKTAAERQNSKGSVGNVPAKELK